MGGIVYEVVHVLFICFQNMRHACIAEQDILSHLVSLSDKKKIDEALNGFPVQK